MGGDNMMSGMIWVLLATLALMTAFATIRAQEVFKEIRREQAVLARQAADGVKTTRAACSYRSYLKNQVNFSEKYLRQHSDGAPALGVTAAQIRQQLDRQRKAYDSLADLACTKRALAPPPPKTTTPAATTSG